MPSSNPEKEVVPEIKKSNKKGKRKRTESNWIDNKRKVLVNSGQEYRSRDGSVRSKKVLGPVCPETCKLKCYEKFDLETRTKIFTDFWKLADHRKQWDYVNKFTSKVSKVRCTTETPSSRQHNVHYFLPLYTDSNSNTPERVRVCQRTFLGTLSITGRIVRTAHTKLSASGTTLPDNRGKQPNIPKINDKTMVHSVCDHVASLQDALARAKNINTNKVTLDKKLTIENMFSMYLDWDQLSNYSNKAQTCREYKHIVNKYMLIERY
ncbi:hypothetical protein O3G_MSEX001929 [Manduca sexta]|uniref:Uncharacterized protein n=1 Tax=Manduca sexta TaxID=7130 RepID=A0A921YM88_MANSE|nr:hypothetical protein O3G_MSEX001929 [Manduca sexta]